MRIILGDLTVCVVLETSRDVLMSRQKPADAIIAGLTATARGEPHILIHAYFNRHAPMVSLYLKRNTMVCILLMSFNGKVAI